MQSTQLVRLPAVDPAEVRAASGFHPHGTWYSPRKRRPGAFTAMQGQPLPESGRSPRPGDEAAE